MPPEGEGASPKIDVLSFEELARIARIFTAMGVKTVRLTGGEPLVRRGIADLVRMIHDEGIDDIALTTNATALGHLARPLRDAGLTRLNISLDSVNHDTFHRLTRGGDLSRVLAGIDAARDVGLTRIKTNAVVVRGFNDDQLVELVEWAWARDIVPRFIELMPLGAAAELGRDAVVTTAEMRERLRDLIDIDVPASHRVDRGPASYLPARDGSKKTVGFIGAVTENFCERCNRVRVTARGEIRACLASSEGISLRDLMRAGNSDEAIREAVITALYGKLHGHEFYVDGVERHEEVAMSRIGG